MALLSVGKVLGSIPSASTHFLLFLDRERKEEGKEKVCSNSFLKCGVFRLCGGECGSGASLGL